MPTYLSEHVYIGNGAQTDYTFNKGYLSRTHVYVKVSTDSGSTYVTKTDPADYEWVDSQTIRFAVAPAADAVIWLDRETPRTIDLNYTNGSVFTDDNQNYGYRQAIYILQEMLDELDRRPSLDVQQNDIEETLAQVVGDLTLSGTDLQKDSFDLKALIGRSADNRLVINLSKINPASANIAIPGASANTRDSAYRIANYTSDFFGDLLYDIGSGAVRVGVVPDEYLGECIEWDGTFRNAQSISEFVAGYNRSNSVPPADTFRELKIQTATGEYTNLHSGLTTLTVDGNDWVVRIIPWFDPASKYGYQIVYKKTTSGGRYPPPSGTYTLVPSSSGGTSAVMEGVGNNFPATLEIERI